MMSDIYPPRDVLLDTVATRSRDHDAEEWCVECLHGLRAGAPNPCPACQWYLDQGYELPDHRYPWRRARTAELQ